MTDETTGAAQPQSAPAPEATPSATGEAWKDVVSQADALAAAIASWARTAYQDPEYRRHADEIGAKLGEMGAKLGEGIQDVAESDFGHRVSETADKVGDALTEGAEKVTKAAGPHVASAFSSMSAALQKAASQVEDAVRKHETPEPPEPAEPATPVPPTDSVDNS
jgi:hypothetical protein